MIFTAYGDGAFDLDGRRVRCALGPAGLVEPQSKREGDGATPQGLWPMRRVLYRPDRGPRPRTALAAAPLAPEDGWCDDPADPAYNRQVRLPHAGRAEALWREDSLYDLIVVLAYNDDPPVAGRGSAIFLHVARPDFGATHGCVALARPDLEEVLAKAGPGSALCIAPVGGRTAFG